MCTHLSTEGVEPPTKFSKKVVGRLARTLEGVARKEWVISEGGGVGQRAAV